MRSRRISVLLALALVVAFPGQASAQLDARDAPTTNGPLSSGQKGCDGGKEMHEGELVARVRLCYRVFIFDPASEDDENRDYGVIWLQSNVDAQKGWCTTAVRTSALVSEGGRAHDYSPDSDITASKRKRVKRTLKVDAQGSADQNGRITQTFVMFPDRLKPSLRKGDGGKRFKLTWKGSTARKLAFASGLEISWPAMDGSPKIDPKLTYDFSAQPQGC